MREIWIISDTHFNHNNIISYCGRPFANAEIMNECLLDNWNSVIKPQDKVYHLGDVYMGGGFPREETVRLLKSLNGHKRLILGNHDNGKDQILQSCFEKIDMWRMFPEFGLLLTHVPVHESSLYRGKTGNEENPEKLLNIHGHTHNKGAPSVDHKCVCVELTNYYPVNIETLRIK
jgi:calcineurin-like phosphoesterase family protein